MELIKKVQKYTNKKGEEKTSVKFYLRVEGLNKDIAVSPYEYGAKGNTYNALNMIAKYEK